MKNRDWSVELFENDTGGVYWGIELHNIEIITPYLLEEILKDAYENSITYISINIAAPELSEDGYFYLLDDYTYQDELRNIQQKYRKLGLGMDFAF